MPHGKTIELNKIPQPGTYAIINERNENGELVRKTGAFIAPFNTQGSPSKGNVNSFLGLQHLKDIAAYQADVRRGEELPNAKRFLVNKTWRKLNKIGRKMRKYNLINN